MVFFFLWIRVAVPSTGTPATAPNPWSVIQGLSKGRRLLLRDSVIRDTGTPRALWNHGFICAGDIEESYNPGAWKTSVQACKSGIVSRSLRESVTVYTFFFFFFSPKAITCICTLFLRRPPFDKLENSFDFVRDCLIECWAENPDERPDLKVVRTKLRPLKKGMWV